MPTDPDYFDLTAPVRGLDKQSEVGGQAEGTTPDATNFRGLDPGTRRLRGGARSGLSKYVGERVGGLDSVVQHLNVVTYIDYDAMSANEIAFPPPPPPNFPPGTERPPESETPGTGDPVPWPDPDDDDWPFGPPDVPEGGSGTRPNPNVPPQDDPGGEEEHGWVWITGASVATLSPFSDTRTDSLELANVQQHQLIVLAVFIDCVSTAFSFEFPPVPSSGFDCTVSDSLGNTYTQAEMIFVPEDSLGGSEPPVGLQAYFFHTRTNGAAATLTIQAEVTADLAPRNKVREVILMAGHYGGLENASPFENSRQNSGTTTVGVSTQTLGGNVVNGNTRLAVGFFGYNGGANAVAAGPGFVRRLFETGGVTVFPTCVLVDDLSTGVSSDPAVEWTDVVASPFVAVGGGFRFGA